MGGKCRPSLRHKTLDNVRRSNLSQTDKDCIMAAFERLESIVRCGECALDNTISCPLCYIEKRTLQFINHDANFYCGSGVRKDGANERVIADQN
jgi:hypothetical protein